MEKNNDQEPNKMQYMPIGMCIGISIGMAIGAAAGNIAIGMCFGVSLGMCVGLIIDSMNNKNRKDEPEETKEETE